jgi:hypothetical protein
MYNAVYEFFKDQGSVIAGLLALLAGWLLYRAGSLQARAAQGQLEHMKAAAEEHDRRSREDLLAMFDLQAARIPMLVTMRLAVAEKNRADATYVAPVFLSSFKIAMADIEGVGVSTLVPGKVRLAAIDLRASVDQLNSLIDVKGPLPRLEWEELIEALGNVRKKAVKLQRALGEHGGDRRII